MSYRINRLVNLSMLLALTVVVERLLSFEVPFLRFSIAFAPIAVAGILYGPLGGGCIAVLADLFGMLLFPKGPYFFGFTMIALIVGVVYGLLLYKKRITWFKAALAAVVVCVGVHILLNSYNVYLYMMSVYKMGSQEAYIYILSKMPMRILSNVIMIAIQIPVIYLLGRLCNKMISRDLELRFRSLRSRAKTYFLRFPDTRPTISDAIMQHAISLPEYAAAHTVFCFAGTAREIDTAALLEQILADGKRVCLPLSLRDGTMTARKISSLDELNIGLYGILEPDTSAPIIKAQDIDLAFVPCSAADRARNRLGKGGGYYDRYLKDTDIIKIGLCPRAWTVSRLPFHKGDLPMDKIVTERGVF